MVSTSSKKKVAVVTGASSGIGREISLTLARNGFLTYATMRNLNKMENIKSVAEKENLPVKIMMLDVTDDGSMSKCVVKFLILMGINQYYTKYIFIFTFAIVRLRRVQNNNATN